MKALFFAPVLFLGLLIAHNPVSARSIGPEGTEGTNVIASRLEYRLYPNAKRNTYTLALERTQTEPAQIQILSQDGSPVYTAEVKEKTLLRRFDLRPLQPGQYTLQITSGSQTRTQTLTVE